MSDGHYEFLLIDPGPRPPFQSVAVHLWGIDCDVDSDGDSHSPDDSDWKELTLILRPDRQARIDVDPVAAAEILTLRISSEQELLAREAAEYLADRCGGTLATST